MGGGAAVPACAAGHTPSAEGETWPWTPRQRRVAPGRFRRDDRPVPWRPVEMAHRDSCAFARGTRPHAPANAGSDDGDDHEQRRRKASAMHTTEYHAVSCARRRSPGYRPSKVRVGAEGVDGTCGLADGPLLWCASGSVW